MAYSFDDAKHSYVGLNCMDIPVLALIGGDWPADAKQFTLNVDGVVREIEIFQGPHGRAMIIDDQKIVASFTAAKREITFRVGKNWARSVPPSPRLEDARQRCLSSSAQA